MIRRLLTLVILVVLVVVVLYYWKYRRPIDSGDLGRKVREEVGDVGQKLKDTKTTGEVKAAFSLNRSIQPYDISVSTENGVVTLRGEVPSADVVTQAEKVAAAVPDVRQVVNQLQVNATSARSSGLNRTIGEGIDDQKLEVQVRLAFSLTRELKDTDIGVKVYRRQVTLSGTVGNEAQRQTALRIAKEIPDVTNVLDQIQVGGGATRPVGDGALPAPLGADGGGAVVFNI